MGAELPVFTQEEMDVDDAQGFPKAYALLCRISLTNGPFAHGPPLSFIPYALQSQEALRVNELNQMLPIIDPEVSSSANMKSYANFLWEQLDHLGKAGFEPALFRVDYFGNVVYRHAHSASPLAWDIDHWFPSSRGGKTVPSNLRILQWQVCKKKKNKLDFLIPWWDLQLGISINQFLSIIASRNSDFRNRALSFLFPDVGGEELNCLQNLYLHSFPQKFLDAKRKQGLAPAAITSLQNSSETMVLKTVDLNRSSRHNAPFPASMKSFHKEDVVNQELQRFRSSISKENNHSAIDNHENNPYLTISCARESLMQAKMTLKHQEQINQLDEDLNELKHQNDIERIALQELEAVLIRRRRRMEKCRRLSEAQASHRSLLEKMIRDAMHQTVVYKEQLRLNQAASSALMARLEAQRAACNSSENELRRRYKQRNELETHAMAFSDEAPRRSRIYDDCHENSSCRVRRPTKKELRVFLEEEQKAFEAGISLSFDDKEESEENESEGTPSIINDEEHCQPSNISKTSDDIPLPNKLKVFAIGEDLNKRTIDQNKQFSYSGGGTSYILEGNDTVLVSKEKDLTVNNKIKKIQQKELNVIKINESCKMINKQKKQTSCNVEGHDAILVSNNLKKVQKRGHDAIKTNESQKHLNLHLRLHEQEEESAEYQNSIGKRNVEKWLHILLENSKEVSSNSGSHPTSYILEGNDTVLVSKEKDLTVNNKIKKIQHKELNVIKINESCKMINDQKKQTSCNDQKKQTSCNVEGHDANLVSNNLKKVKKRGLDAIKANASQKHWNLHLRLHEQEEESAEYENSIGKWNVEKWLHILLENSKEGSSNSGSHPTSKNFGEPTNKTNTEMKQNEISLCAINNGREKHYSYKIDSEKKFKDKSRVEIGSTALKVSSRSDRQESKAGLPKCQSSESSRGFIASPSILLGMRKSVDCMRRKPMVIGDDENANEICIFTNGNIINNNVTKTTKKEPNK